MINLKIILIKDVKKKGKKGDILNVRDGYGTFLIKNGDAVLATSGGLNRLDRENKDREKRENELIEECELKKKKIEKETLVFKVKVGSGDKVFGSISSKQISEKLKKYGIDKKQIKLSHSIDTLGFHDVDIELHKKVIATVKIQLVK